MTDTEGKPAENVLRESAELYRSFFENMPDGFAWCKMIFENEQPIDFEYLAVNRAFEKLTGQSNVVGKRVTELVPGIRESSPELFEIYGRVALTGLPERFETYLSQSETWSAPILRHSRKEPALEGLCRGRESGVFSTTYRPRAPACAGVTNKKKTLLTMH